MATAILRSHDCLIRDRLGPRNLQSSNPNPNPNPRMNHATKCRRRKRSPSDGNRRSNRENIPSPSSSPPLKGLVMGQVKILKRGEELKPKMFFNNRESDLSSTDRLGPDPQVLQKQIRVSDLYAGSTSLVSSPSPSELPFPTALVRSRVMESDLRKWLKI